MVLLGRIFEVILPVFLLVAIGYGYARLRGKQAITDIAAVNRVNMEVLCPFLIFTALASKDFDISSNLPLMLAGALIALGSGLLAWPFSRMLGYDPRSFVPPMMFNNCGNMGLPLSVLAFGTAALPSAVALFMSCTLIYFSVGIKILEAGRDNSKTPFFKFLLSPIMIGMFAGIFFSLFRISLPAPLFSALKMLGEASIPIMLFALGIRMIDVSFKCWRIGLIGALFCPLAGLLIARILDSILTLNATQKGQMYLFASLPPAVLCYMFAEHYNQEPEKVASIVLLGNLLAVVFVPLGLWLGM
jgi:malate permease and related proteins